MSARPSAIAFLGKAKSLKSVGGLEQFVREFMLDEPDTLARLPEALKQIDPLVEARELWPSHRRSVRSSILIP